MTNRQFREFVDRDGYRKKEYWKHEFKRNGTVLTWEKAMAEFVDQTGRPGPSTWQAGNYHEGQEDYPVTGVSWYEAAAYAEFKGKNFPTLGHWNVASRGGWMHFSSILMLLSNFEGKGPAAVGSYKGITPYGVYDMAGNAREWCWNDSQIGQCLRGGAWNDAGYMFNEITTASPFDRSEKNGFRCVLYLERDKIPENAFQLYTPRIFRNYYEEVPVSDEVSNWYKEPFSYDETDLNTRVEMRDESSDEWIHEKITFDAAYGNERVIAHLFLPKKYSPPYQTVVYFPGIGSNTIKSSENLVGYYEFERFLSFIITNGRAVMYPVYKGTFERGDEIPTFPQWNLQTHEYADYLTELVKDFRRSLDYLETREDIDISKLAYYGYSWGGVLGNIIPAVENRLKISILLLGAMKQRLCRPEADPINYVTRVKIPTLMLNGKYDNTHPFETCVKPMFDLLGTPEEHKDLKIYESDQFIPRNEIIKETLNWLDKYLGPVTKKQE